MKGSSPKYWNRITVGLLVMIMSIMLINKAVYTHVHLLPDGSVAVHAHPFSKTTGDNKGGSHQHSSLEIFLLNMLDVLIFSAFAAFSLKLFAIAAHFITTAADPLLLSLVPVSPGRAPPACM